MNRIFLKSSNRTLGQAKALRKKQTPAEKILWRKLRANRFHKFKFKRQVPIGAFIADFCCKDMKLVIEVDGCVHQFKRKSDRERDKYIRNHGYRILRFRNSKIGDNRKFCRLK